MLEFEFLDFHTHHPAKRKGVLAIEASHFSNPESGIRNPELSENSGIRIPDPACMKGIHPWFLPMDLEAAMRWLRFEVSQNDCLAVGECGLDRAISTDFEEQGIVFMQCAMLAEEVEKPLVIHCVRANDEILAFKKMLKPRQTWIMHGFGGHPNTAKQLIANGLWLSFGHAILKNENAAAALAAMPADRFFLETDDQADVYIEDIYQRAAKIRGQSLADLQLDLKLNFAVLFGPPGGGAALSF